MIQKTILNQFHFNNENACHQVLEFVIEFMERSIQKGIYSTRKIEFFTEWNPDFSIIVFEEILSQKITVDNQHHSLIEGFTLVGNSVVEFTVTHGFYDYYLGMSR